MIKKSSSKILPHHPAAASSSKGELLAVLPSGIITVTRGYVIRYVNAAAEDFLGGSLASLRGHKLSHFIHPAKHLLALIDSAFASKALIKEYDFTLSGPRMGERRVNLQLMPLDDTEEVMLVVDDRGMISKLSHHLLKRENARAASGMASILAHEVKNPLSGIRGAAQLLAKTVSAQDKELTTLICNEVDRIKDVIDEIEIFSDQTSLKTEPVNIHEVLQYVRLIIEKGMARHVTFREIYDPSLPEVAGHRNLLIQLFLNIIKNAVEALADNPSPTITLTTSYHSGFRLKPQGDSAALALPIVVSVEDNGEGIPAELRENIFDPFVTTKEGGKGLGLAIAAKIVSDHQGAIELDTDMQAGTRFKILLPAK